VVMRHPGTDDKIVIARREGDKHWTYFSVRDNADNETIIASIRRRTPAPLGDIRRELRSWLGTDRPPSFPRRLSATVPVASLTVAMPRWTF
jgi:hypothetical protein